MLHRQLYFYLLVFSKVNILNSFLMQLIEKSIRCPMSPEIVIGCDVLIEAGRRIATCAGKLVVPQIVAALREGSLRWRCVATQPRRTHQP